MVVERTARRAGWTGLAAVAAAWLLVVIGGRLQPGYDVWRDRISPMSAHGAEAPIVVTAAILLLALAYLAAAVVLRDWVGTPVGAGLLVGAALSTVVVALARLDCPGGATGCARNEGGNRLIGPAAANPEGLVHSVAVLVAYGFVLATMLLLTVLWWRRGNRRVRAAASAAALVASLATVPFWTFGEYPGAVQRLWLGILSAWLVLVLVRPLVDAPPATSEEQV